MSRERPAGEFGKTLRQAREKKGISLRAVADITRISVAALEALERDDISRLPGGIFSRAFVRAYAAEVGLNPDATVDEFVRLLPDVSVTVGHPTVRYDDLDAPGGGTRARSVGLTLLLIGVVVAAIVLYLRIVGWHGKPVVPPPVSVSSSQKAPAPSAPDH